MIKQLIIYVMLYFQNVLTPIPLYWYTLYWLRVLIQALWIRTINTHDPTQINTLQEQSHSSVTLAPSCCPVNAVKPGHCCCGLCCWSVVYVVCSPY